MSDVGPIPERGAQAGYYWVWLSGSWQPAALDADGDWWPMWRHGPAAPEMVSRFIVGPRIEPPAATPVAEIADRLLLQTLTRKPFDGRPENEAGAGSPD